MNGLFVNTVQYLQSDDTAFIRNFYVSDTKRLLKGCVVVVYINVIHNLLCNYKK